MKISYPFFILLVISTFLSSTAFGQGAHSLYDNNNAEFEASDNYSDLTVSGDRLVFWNNGIYVSDGTQEGTIPLVVEGLGLYNYIGTIDNSAFFTLKIEDNYHISKLDIDSDVMVNIYTNEDRPFDGLVWNNDIYFKIDSETSFGGDDLVKLNVETGESEIIFTSDFGGIRGLGATDNELMLIASMDDGKFLVKSDGTASNSIFVKKLYEAGSDFANAVFMKSDGQKMWFFYHPNNNPYNLWISDGTEANTNIIGVYDSPSFGVPPGAFEFLNGKFYFIMRAEGAPSGQTFELHVSDGTSAGTYNVDNDGVGYWHPRNLTVFNDQIYFSSLDGNWGVYRTNGLPGNREVIISPFGFQQAGGVGGGFDFGTFNDKLIIQARRDDIGYEAFLSNGNPNSAILFLDINPGEADGSPRHFRQVGDKIFFVATKNDVRGIWVYDPTFQVDPCVNGIQVDSMIVDGTGGELGSAIFTPSGDNPPFLFSLNGGTFTSGNNFTNLTAGLYTMTIEDAQGCSVEFQFDIDVESNIVEPNLLNTFSIHPNPAVPSEDLLIDFSLQQPLDDLTIEIVNFQGQVIKTTSYGKLSGTQQIRLSKNNLGAGIYLVNIKAGNQLLGNKRIMFLD